ncbi:MAG: YncE family protein [Gemmatimonadota bacterium]
MSRCRRTVSKLRSLALAVLIGCAGVPAGSAPGTAPAPSDTGTAAGDGEPAELLYICVQDEAKIAVVDMASLELVHVVDLTSLGFSANAKPHHIAVDPDGEHWYVSLIGENRVVRLDRDGALVGQYETETPGMLALDPEGPLLLASRTMSAVSPPPLVSLIDPADMEGDEIEVLFPRPHPLALSRDGRWAYTGSLGENVIAAIDLEAEEATLTPVEGPPHAFVQFAVSPDGRTLVAATELSGLLMAFDLADPAHPALLASVEVGPIAFDPAYAPDGRSVWVPVKGANQVAIVDPATWTVVRRIEGPSLRQPHAVVFSPDGRHAFVSNNAKADHMADPGGGGEHAAHGPATDTVTGNVTVIDVATHSIVKAIELGSNVTGMGTRHG